MSGFANLFLGGMVLTAAATQIPKGINHVEGIIKDQKEAHETIPSADQSLSNIGSCYMEITTDRYTYKVEGIVSNTGNQLKISYTKFPAEITYDFRTQTLKIIEPAYSAADKNTERTRPLQSNKDRKANSYESDLLAVMQRIQECVPTTQQEEQIVSLNSLIQTASFEK